MRFAIRFLALLVIVNVLVFLWPEPHNGSEQNASLSELNPEFISLNGVSDASEIKPQGKQKDKVAHRAQTESEPIHSTQGQSTQGLLSCYRLGPFLKQETYLQAQEKLTQYGVEYTEFVRESQKSQVYRVYLGPYLTRQSVLQAKYALLEKGVKDHFLRKHPDNSYLISLGIFSTREGALVLMEQLKGKVENMLLRDELLDLPTSYWLDMKFVDKGYTLQSLNGVDWGDRSVHINRIICQK